MNPFGTDSMAAGYAFHRPPVHERILARVEKRLAAPVSRALDLGCGAGVSTRALSPFTRHCIGMDPAVAMLKHAGVVAPSGDFLAGSAERIPLARQAVDLIAAAGSLNYVNLPPFFEEATRVLTPRGVIAAYDFTPGCEFPGDPSLRRWFTAFQQRYPPPPREARELTPRILNQLSIGFTLGAHEAVEIEIPLTGSFYVNYMLTETNVAFAVRTGTSLSSIRHWCEDTLGRFWGSGERSVIFRGYYACLERVAA